MPEHEGRKLQKRKVIVQKHLIKQKEPKLLINRPHVSGVDTTPVTDTPFNPSVEEHTTLLSQANSDKERADQVLRLQRTYGNRYVQSLLNLATLQPKLESKIGYLSQMIATEPIEEEEMMVEARAAATEPIEEEEEMMVGDRSSITSYPGFISTNQKLSPVLVPVDPSKAGACVIVKDKKFSAWYNPSQPKCVLGGMKIHEEKHITDFNADPNYKDIPTKGLTWAGPVKGLVPDGETFYYRNNDDAKKFEHPAIDLEIGWLNEQLKTNLSEGDKKIITNRATKTLPAYKKSFG